MPRSSYDSIRGNKIIDNPLIKFLNGIKLESFVLFVAFTFIFTMKFTLLLLWGWFGPPLAYPSISYSVEGQNLRGTGIDTDGDGLPDVIEMAPRGAIVVNEEGRRVGTGTGTDPLNPDTDGDFFPDGLEDSIGADPLSWIYPGFVWIFWTVLIIVVIYVLFFRKVDRTKQYIKNEEMISGSTVKSGQKFAYSMPQIPIKSVGKSRSVKDIYSFRSSLASDIFEIDDNTALGYAMHKKRSNWLRFAGSVFLTIVFTAWAIMDSTDKVVNDKYDSYDIDKLIGAGVKAVFAFVSLLSAIFFYRRYDRSDRRSRNLLEE